MNVPACLLDKWQGFFLGGGGTWGKMGLAVGLMVSSVLIYCCVRVLYFFEGVLFFGGGGGGKWNRTVVRRTAVIGVII